MAMRAHPDRAESKIVPDCTSECILFPVTALGVAEAATVGTSAVSLPKTIFNLRAPLQRTLQGFNYTMMGLGSRYCRGAGLAKATRRFSSTFRLCVPG